MRRELQGQQRLPGPLAFIRPKHSSLRFQLHAYREDEHVIVEIEPLNPLGKRHPQGW